MPAGQRRSRAARGDRGGRRRGRARAPGEQHQLAGGPRPDQQHHAAALPPALLDPAERVRYRARRPRRGAERGHPPRQPGPAGDRRGPEASSPARTANWPAWRATPIRRSAARPRARALANFIVEANDTGEATAERRTDIARGIERLPAFLRELRGLMADLEDLTDQGPRCWRPGHRRAGPRPPDRGPGHARRRHARGLPEPRRRARARPPRSDPRRGR